MYATLVKVYTPAVLFQQCDLFFRRFKFITKTSSVFSFSFSANAGRDRFRRRRRRRRFVRGYGIAQDAAYTRDRPARRARTHPEPRALRFEGARRRHDDDDDVLRTQFWRSTRRAADSPPPPPPPTTITSRMDGICDSTNMIFSFYIYLFRSPPIRRGRIEVVLRTGGYTDRCAFQGRTQNLVEGGGVRNFFF